MQTIPPSPAGRDACRPLSLLVGCAFLMEQLDATIVAPAMPDIAADFGIAPLALNLTMTLYLLCGVAFIPVGGHLAARWGTRRVFRGALLLFVLSSLLCAVASDLPLLAAARALQGLSAALMVPVGRMAIVHATPRSQLVPALAWMIMPAMLGPLLGPPLGGLIASTLSWPWIFLINLPVGLVCWWQAWRWMPQIREPMAARFDPCAWALMTGCLAGLIAALEVTRQGAADGIPSWLLPALASGSAGLALAFLRRSRRASAPLLDFGLLREPTFHASFWSGALARVGFGALPFLLPLAMQLGLGFSAWQSGLALLASGAVAFVTKSQTTTLLRSFGFRRVLVVNGLLCAAGLAACALFDARWSLAAIAVTVSLAGFFRSIQFNALGAIAYAGLPPGRIAAATTLNTMAQQLAVMLGISLSALVVDLSSRQAGHAVPAGTDFTPAFCLLAFFALGAVPACLRLRADAGHDLIGHRPSAS
jgi:EmrB/QacA subfamily drug resistance transporter